MIVLSNTSAQTLAPGQSITFNAVVMHTGDGECHRPGSSSIKMRNKGIYKISFSANVTSATVGDTTQLAIEVGGEILPETTMKSTTSTANAFNNIATTTAYKNGCCDYDRITVANTSSTVSVTIDANPTLFVKRIS